MLNICLNVCKNRCTVKNLDIVTSGCVNTARCVFSFSEEWAEYSKIASFECGDETYHASIEEDACLIPNVILRDENPFTVGVVGISSDNKTVTTNKVNLRMIKGVDKDGTSDPDYEPTIIEHIANKDIHVGVEDKERWNSAQKNVIEVVASHSLRVSEPVNKEITIDIECDDF